MDLWRRQSWLRNCISSPPNLALPLSDRAAKGEPGDRLQADAKVINKPTYYGYIAPDKKRHEVDKVACGIRATSFVAFGLRWIEFNPRRKDVKFHYLARGIILKRGKVLLAHLKGAENTFLPGGHIKTGEKAESALLREIEEEIGKKAIIKQFTGAVECSWVENDQRNHEINLLFEVQIPDLDPSEPLASRESHLEFFWANPTDLHAHSLLPDPIIECLMNWELGFHGFWGSAFEKATSISAEHMT